QGIGFAIPVDRARRVMHDLVAFGEVRRPWTGLVVQDLTPDLAQHFGTRRGVIVAEVEPESPAERAGVARGEGTVRADGREVGSREEFDQRVAAHAESDRIPLTRRRDGREEDVDLRAAAFPSARVDDLAWRLLGLEVDEEKEGLAVRRVRPG